MSEHRGGPETFDRDINLKAIVVTGISLALLIALSMLFMWWMAKGLKRVEVAQDPPPRPIPEAVGRQLPPEPRLQGAPGSAFEEKQGSPELELQQMRAEEERALTSYEWVDEAGGVARIPVERAIEILSEEGLPEVVSAPSAEAAGGLAAPPAPDAAGAEGSTNAP